MKKITRLSLILFVFFVFTSFGEKKSFLPKANQYKAFYKTTYGRFSFDEILIQRKIKSNEFLSNIFAKNDIDLGHLNQLVSLPDSLFNAKNIVSGSLYTISYKRKGNTLKPNRFIYEKNKVEYIVASFNNGFKYKLGKKPVKTVERVVSGTVDGALYTSLENQDINPNLAVSLAQIYAWTIDFHKIQKGDAFKIMYVEQFVEGKSLNDFDVKGVIFTHKGEEKEAYYFKGADDDKGYYYDQNGDNMKQAFLKAPVKYSRISSPFSSKRFHPVQKRWKAHLGTDYAAPSGTPIIATADGVVVESEFKKYNGNYVKIKHYGDYATQYLHMSKRAVKKGERVKQGQVIGYVGSTGLASGPHVCYRFWKDGKQVDPKHLDIPRAEPIKDKYKNDYFKQMKPIREALREGNRYQHEV